MTTAEDILNKSKTKKPNKFQPVQRRAWDYLDTSKETESPQQNDESEKSIDPIATININNPKNEKTKKLNIAIESHLKPDQNDTYRESIESPTKEVFQKKLLTLTGHQREIMRLITSHIKSRGGMPYTVSLFPNILAIKIKSHIDVVRVSLKRLVEKNLLVRMKGEKGRNGCCKFKMREDIVKACFTLFNDTPCDINVIENKGEELE